MNPTLVTFIGFVVVVLILMWAALEITRRYIRQRHAHEKARDTWLTVKPTPPKSAEESFSEQHNEEDENTTENDPRKRFKQNGHYSQSKKPL
ncbi:MAG: hypothetical protein NVSMB49_07260 [Ktedonobacteraceae bacterium]